MNSETEIYKIAITVLMPVYNASNYLNEAIESILNQSFIDFEFLIINDGSTDQSEEIIMSYKDARIRYIKKEENQRLIATLNEGFKLAKGKYIVRMDADDISLPKRLEKQFRFMEGNSQIVLSGSWCESFGDNRGISKYQTNHDAIKFKMMYQCHIVHPTIIIRKSILDTINPKFDPNFIHAEDYELFVRIGENHLLANIPEVLLKYRVHSKSISNTYTEIQLKNSAEIRTRIFKNLGFSISKELLDDYIKLNYQDYKNINSSGIQIKNMLEQIKLKNDESGYFNYDYLEVQIALVWFHYCYNTKQRNLYYNSFLSKSKAIRKLDKIKLFIKS